MQIEQSKIQSAAARPGRKISTKQAFYPLLIVIAFLLAYLPWLGSYGPIDPTDSFFLESGRELIETGKYILPLNNYVPWLDKPILFFWMLVASFKLLGVNTFAGRLPAALSALLTALIIYAGSRPMLKRPVAAFAALIFLACPLSSIIGHVCLTDMTLCALICGSLLFLFKGVHYSSKKDLLTGYFFLALSFLCKGPIALIICAASFLAFFALTSSSRAQFFSSIKSMQVPGGLFILLLLNAPWYIAAELESGGRFLTSFFYTQNFGRMMGTVNHQGPFYFYIPVFLGGFFPWSLFSVAAPGFFINSFKRRFNARNSFTRFANLNLVFFVIVIALFSIIKTKLPTYILPALPAFSILVAMQIYLLARTKKLQVLYLPVGILLLGLIAGVFVQGLLKGYVREIFSQNLWIFAPLFILILLSGFALSRKRQYIFAGALLAMSLLSCALLVPRGLQIFYRERQMEFNRLVLAAKNANASIAMVFAEEPSVPWLTHKPVSRLMNREDARAYLQNTPGPHYVLVQPALLGRLDWFDGSPKLMIDSSRKWHLYEIANSSKN